MQPLSRTIRNRSLRALAVWTLVLVQAAFLWFGEFHRHEVVEIQSGKALCLLNGSGGSKGVLHVPFCVACQIGHERAASPIVGHAPAASAAVDHGRVSLEAPRPSRSHFGNITPRAPPV